MKKIFILVLALFMSSLVFSAEPLAVGSKMPNLKLKTLKGKTFNLYSIKGKKVLLSFAATWWPHCKVELEGFQPYYTANLKDNKDIAVVTVFGDYGNGDSMETVKKYLKNNEYNFPAYFDANQVALKAAGIEAFPSSFLLDENFVITEMGGAYTTLPSFTPSLLMKKQ